MPWVFHWVLFLINHKHFDKNYRITINLYAGNFSVLCNIMVVSSWKKILCLCLVSKSECFRELFCSWTPSHHSLPAAVTGDFLLYFICLWKIYHLQHTHFLQRIMSVFCPTLSPGQTLFPYLLQILVGDRMLSSAVNGNWLLWAKWFYVTRSYSSTQQEFKGQEPCLNLGQLGMTIWLRSSLNKSLKNMCNHIGSGPFALLSPASHTSSKVHPPQRTAW